MSSGRKARSNRWDLSNFRNVKIVWALRMGTGKAFHKVGPEDGESSWPGLGFYTGKMKWNESGFRPPFCTYRLNWARGTSWGWWDDWDDTVLQTQDSKFEPWRSEAEHATSRSRRLPTILTFTRGWGRNIFCFFQTAETGNRTPNSGVKGSGADHYPRAPALYGEQQIYLNVWSVDILSISVEQVSQSNMQFDCILWFAKLLYIF